MVISSWNFNHDQLEHELHIAYDVALDKLLADDVIDSYQHAEAYRYAPKIINNNSICGWLKNKLFSEDDPAAQKKGAGKHVCVKLYDTYEEEGDFASEPVEDEELEDPGAHHDHMDDDEDTEVDKSQALGTL
ncbi:hypothetical protein HN803_03735 [candidate division WWE3 bacterium]|jgi:hypothetical protein|nr:hypothetical protein [candidate division WWE3 bacterium]